MSEYFTFGTTLITGSNIIGDQDMTGDYISLSDTYSWHLGGAENTHDLKFGGLFTSITEDWYYPVYPQGAMLYATDSRLTPFYYYYFVVTCKF